MAARAASTPPDRTATLPRRAFAPDKCGIHHGAHLLAIEAPGELPAERRARKTVAEDWERAQRSAALQAPGEAAYPLEVNVAFHQGQIVPLLAAIECQVAIRWRSVLSS